MLDKTRAVNKWRLTRETSMGQPRRAKKVDKAQQGIVGYLYNCETCGAEFKSYQKAPRFCSRVCLGRRPDNLIRLAKGALQAAKRPRNRQKKPVVIPPCEICDNPAISATAKTCSSECRSILLKRKPRKPLIANRICENCGIAFHAYRKRVRKYCTYSCFVASGGTIRAGLSAASMAKKNGAKKDSNHREIVDYFLENDIAVKDLSGRGYGIPDLMVGLNGKNIFVEIKNKLTTYGRKGLNVKQRAWARGWKGGFVYLVYDKQDAANIINGKLELVRDTSHASEVAL